MNVKLSIRDVDAVFFESSDDGAEAVTADLELVRWITRNRDLVVE